jgi:polyvinyl alcohol dehydrogenase (cytochrome)
MKPLRKPRLIKLLLAAAGLARLASAVTGDALYKQQCATCHDNPGSTRAPAIGVLRQMSPEAILNALESGLMKEQGKMLAAPDRRALAEWLTGKSIGSAATATGFCEKRDADFAIGGDGWSAWGNGVDNHRYAEVRIDPARLTLKWAFGFPGAAVSFAQPTITGGRMFIGGASRKVYSLDAKTGCTYWIFEPQANVRAAITITPGKVALFADQLSNVYAVDARNGELLWKTHLDDHRSARVTGSPQLWKDRLYVPISSAEDGPSLNPKYECCTGRGGVVALDAKTGKILWHTYSIAETPQPTRKNAVGTQMWGPSGASIWSAPTIDAKRNRLYVGTGDNHSEPETNTSDAILAMDLDTGKIVWSKQLTEHDKFNIACVAVDQTNCPKPAGPDLDVGSSPMIVGNLLIVGQKAAVVHALDLDRDGEIKWQTRIGRGGALGGIQWGMATDGENVYAALSDVEFKAGTGVFGSGTRFEADPKVGGGLFALRIKTGEKVWAAPAPDCGDRKNCSPAQSAAITAIPGAVFSGSVDGHIRAYSAKDGRVIWDFDTAREFTTVNGVAAKGGSMDGPGPVAVDGMIYVPSGYGNWGGKAGNVLLAFAQQ